MFPVKCLVLVHNTLISHVCCLISVISIRCKIIRISVDTVDIVSSVWVSVSHVYIHSYFNGDTGDICTANVIGIIGMDINS